MVPRVPAGWSTGGWPTRSASCVRRSRRSTRCAAGSRRTPGRCRSARTASLSMARPAIRVLGTWGVRRSGWAARARTRLWCGCRWRPPRSRCVRCGGSASRARWTGGAGRAGRLGVLPVLPGHGVLGPGGVVVPSGSSTPLSTASRTWRGSRPTRRAGRRPASRGLRRSRPRVVRRWWGCPPWARARWPICRGC